MKNVKSTIFKDDSMLVEEIINIEEKTNKSVKKDAKTIKKQVELNKNEVISLLESYLHPKYNFIVATNTDAVCKMCGVPVNMQERHLCHTCFEKYNKEIYNQSKAGDKVILIGE